MLPAVLHGLVQRFKGSPITDGSGLYRPARMSKYQDIVVQPTMTDMMGLNEEGSFFVAVNPTPETPIAVTTSIITYAETAGAVGVTLMLRNTEALGENSKRMIMSHIRLMLVQVPTSATHWKGVLALDDNPVRYTSGGSAISTIYNTNGDASNFSVAQVFFGALTTAVPTNRRYISRMNLRGVIPTTFDEYVMTFGWGGNSSSSGAAASGMFSKVVPPCVIRPQQNLCLTMWGIGNAAAPSWEFEVGWIER